MIYKRDEDGYYHKDEQAFPSVGTILSGGKTFKAGDRARIGSIVHYCINSMYADRRLEIPSELMIWSKNDKEVYAERDLAIKMWMDLKWEIEMMHVEEPVFYGNPDWGLCYAGTPDQIFRFRNKIVLNDIKTGDFYYNYLLQIAAYVMAAEKWYDMLIDEAWITQLDLSVERNPLAKPRIFIMTRPILLEYAKEFVDEHLKKFKRIK